MNRVPNIRVQGESCRGNCLTVKFKKMEELVCYGCDGTICIFLNTEMELEGSIGFITNWEGDILQLASRVGYLW